MPEGAPQAGHFGHRAEDGFHVGHAGSRAHPGLGVHAFAERETLPCDFFGGVDLCWRAWRIGVREFGAGGEPQAVFHGRDHVAVLGIDDGAVEWLAGQAGVVHVIPPLGDHGRGVAEAFGELRGPRSQRHDHLAGLQRLTVSGVHLPATRIGFAQCRGVAQVHRPTPLLEQARIGLHQITGAADGHGVGPAHGASERTHERGFFPGHVRARELDVVHAVFGALVGHLEEALQLAFGAVEHEVALPRHEVVGARVVHQLRVRFQ
ncbi:hypothetical protein FQZ97_926510 [compost metagenome]